VKRVLRFLRAEIGNQDSHSLELLATVAGLSTSRLMHVFTESVGVALRPYILWLRVQRALGELMSGATVTGAAHGRFLGRGPSQPNGPADARHHTERAREAALR
jgi:AraC-like DNA-binding protein